MEEDFYSQADIDSFAFARQDILLTKAVGRGFNLGLIILLIIIVVLLVFIMDNYVLYMSVSKIPRIPEFELFCMQFNDALMRWHVFKTSWKQTVVISSSKPGCRSFNSATI
jgi:hypothetical protein